MQTFNILLWKKKKSHKENYYYVKKKKWLQCVKKTQSTFYQGFKKLLAQQLQYGKNKYFQSHNQLKLIMVVIVIPVNTYNVMYRKRTFIDDIQRFLTTQPPLPGQKQTEQKNKKKQKKTVRDIHTATTYKSKKQHNQKMVETLGLIFYILYYT
eukprot:TRINITY_DN4081_c1_g1_i1.p4 TRINITY_DN4081_c1_g1~~TRINITY_DN4081_c1_g1_i1.p4  ORF type:complete len:153 (+),score=4.09 TRINITY_DN4081_c1_g1_i1:229-687(+)